MKSGTNQSEPLVDIVDTIGEARDLANPPLIIKEALEEVLPGSGAIEVERLQAGHSNLTYIIDRDDEQWVLRRPPRPPVPPKAHDVLREHRLISALDDTPVPVPRPVMACDDESVIGAPFYVMQRIDGTVIRESIPPELDDPEACSEIGTAVADALAELHAVDVTEAPLSELGRPAGYLARQVDLWSKQWNRNKTREIPEIEAAGKVLDEHMPTESESSVVHGDYKLDNLIFTKQRPIRVGAILDWEMATLGDPMTDVGYLSATWLGPDSDPDQLLGISRATCSPNLPRIETILARYSETSGRTLEDLAWYRCLAIWKLAILLEGSRKRYLEGTTDDPFFESLEHGIPKLAAQAQELARQIR